MENMGDIIGQPCHCAADNDYSPNPISKREKGKQHKNKRMIALSIIGDDYATLC